MITNPAKLAKIFNEFFINKVRKLRAKSRKVPNSDPVLRVRKWLDKRPSPPPIFKIKKIDTEALRRALKIMKGKKAHGVDNKAEMQKSQTFQVAHHGVGNFPYNFTRLYRSVLDFREFDGVSGF